MEVVHPVCCGIDGHAAQLTACLRRVVEAGTVHTDWQEFGTTYDELLALRLWLDEQRSQHPCRRCACDRRPLYRRSQSGATRT